MSFIGDLFGGGDAPAPATPPPPQPVQATPTISDAASHSADIEAANRLNKRQGMDSSILTSGLGDSSFGATDVNRTSALGGNSSLTPNT